MDKNYQYFLNKIKESSLPPSAILVYMVLLQYADRTTWTCFPSVKTIGFECSLSERTIRRYINLLVKKAYIIKLERTRKNNGKTSNLYVLR